MKFGFVTCVQLGLACMESIYEVGGKLDLVMSLSDELARKKSGRIYVDEFCEQYSIPSVKIKNINDDEAIAAIRKNELDWLFIIGWSQIARREVLLTPKFGVVGIHPTLLPEGRGRAAIPWAILKGLKETGVTMFKLDEGVDTGPIISKERITILPDETASTLYEKACRAHSVLIKRMWPTFVENKITLIPQDESRASEWPGRTPDDGQILPTMTVEEVDRLVRATTDPYPGAFYMDNGKTIRIWRGIPHGSHGCDKKMEYKINLKDGIYLPIEYDIEERELFFTSLKTENTN